MSSAPPLPGELKTCRYCATTIPRAASFCPNCRKRLGTHPLVAGCAALIAFTVLGIVAVSLVPKPAPPPLTEEAKKAQAAAEELKRQSEATARAFRESEEKRWKESPAGVLCAKHPGWNRAACDAIAKKEIHIGMTSDQVVLAWGKPYKVNSTITSRSKHEQWVMTDSLHSDYLYFEDGVLTSLQRSK